ncbi:hypothetical protein [Phenylobacterium sp.]|jgi:hypothetical protein|uniref:hypothetical protein n=1 Tax=Phenylobacterium sp. TaxID=1871053 RepID=UPI0037852872
MAAIAPGAGVRLLDIFKQAARPFSIYAATVAVCAGVFVPFVTVEKLAIAASLSGVVAGLRSLDKRTPAG